MSCRPPAQLMSIADYHMLGYIFLSLIALALTK